ncbi:hypothetical protein PoB_000107100 [Plakobranchus ocellatus]|uniref:Uncharacterized protein n=1 Tax=Plakobranchus ocellatus TaxID=259542 RepID=A0AAV3XUU9_9GAST|nr:hypothetical protein PoB_000107100 [Plakobranchus ocellatus]
MKRYCQGTAPSLPCKKAIARVWLHPCPARRLLPECGSILALQEGYCQSVAPSLPCKKAIARVWLHPCRAWNAIVRVRPILA